MSSSRFILKCRMDIETAVRAAKAVPSLLENAPSIMVDCGGFELDELGFIEYVKNRIKQDVSA